MELRVVLMRTSCRVASIPYQLDFPVLSNPILCATSTGFSVRLAPIYAQIPTVWKVKIEKGRMLVISSFKEYQKYVTEGASLKCNNLAD